MRADAAPDPNPVAEPGPVGSGRERIDAGRHTCNAMDGSAAARAPKGRDLPTRPDGQVTVRSVSYEVARRAIASMP